MAKFKFVSKHRNPYVYYGECGAQFMKGEFQTDDERVAKYLRIREDIEEVKVLPSEREAEFNAMKEKTEKAEAKAKETKDAKK